MITLRKVTYMNIRILQVAKKINNLVRIKTVIKTIGNMSFSDSVKYRKLYLLNSKALNDIKVNFSPLYSDECPRIALYLGSNAGLVGSLNYALSQALTNYCSGNLTITKVYYLGTKPLNFNKLPLIKLKDLAEFETIIKEDFIVFTFSASENNKNIKIYPHNLPLSFNNNFELKTFTMENGSDQLHKIYLFYYLNQLFFNHCFIENNIRYHSMLRSKDAIDDMVEALKIEKISIIKNKSVLTTIKDEIY